MMKVTLSDQEHRQLVEVMKATPDAQSSPKLPLLQCGMKSTLRPLHQFEEQQLLGRGQTWASPPGRPGMIHHQ
jgi:hypothetical protein